MLICKGDSAVWPLVRLILTGWPIFLAWWVSGNAQTQGWQWSLTIGAVDSHWVINISGLMRQQKCQCSLVSYSTHANWPLLRLILTGWPIFLVGRDLSASLLHSPRLKSLVYLIFQMPTQSLWLHLPPTCCMRTYLLLAFHSAIYITFTPVSPVFTGASTSCLLKETDILPVIFCFQCLTLLECYPHN